MKSYNRAASLEEYRDFWDSTAAVYSNAKLTNEGGEDLETMLSHVKCMENLVCLGTATGCRDPVFFLDKGVKPKRIIANDLSPQLLKTCLANLQSYEGIDVLPLEGPIHHILGTAGKRIKEFLGDTEPVLCVSVYRKEAFYTRFNGYSALELYSEEMENIGNICTVCPIFYGQNTLTAGSAAMGFTLPLTAMPIRRIKEFLQGYEHSERFGGFQFNSVKDGNPFVSHYYTQGLLEQLFADMFPGCQISVTDTKTRSFVVFVSRNSHPNTMITMINNVLGNIPHYLQEATLCSIRNLFFR